MTLLELTTIDRVKTLLDQEESNASDDALLATMIRSVSAAIETWIDRRLFLEARVEYHDIEVGQRLVQLGSWPVTAVTAVETSPDADWANATAVAASDFFRFDAEGIIQIRKEIPAGMRTLRISYTGGVAATTSALLADTTFADISGAAELQVAHEYRRRMDPGSQSSAVAGGSQTHATAGPSKGEVGLLFAVTQRLTHYRRWTL